MVSSASIEVSFPCAVCITLPTNTFVSIIYIPVDSDLRRAMGCFYVVRSCGFRCRRRLKIADRSASCQLRASAFLSKRSTYPCSL